LINADSLAQMVAWNVHRGVDIVTITGVAA
jgi:hypothetical protein